MFAARMDPELRDARPSRARLHVPGEVPAPQISSCRPRPRSPRNSPPTTGPRALIGRPSGKGGFGSPSPRPRRLLAAYGIPAVATRIAQTPEEAAALAAEIGAPWRSRSSLRTSPTSPTSGVWPWASWARRRAGRRLRDARPHRAGAARGPHDGLQRSTHGAPPRRLRADRRGHRRCAVRPGDPLRPRGHGGRGHRRPGPRAAAPQHAACAEIIARTRIYKQLKGFRGLPGAISIASRSP